MKKWICLLLIINFSYSFIYANEKDSILAWLKNTPGVDTNHVLAYKALVYHYLLQEGNVEEALNNSSQGLKIALKIPSEKLTAKLYSLQAYIKSNYTTDYESAINDYYAALKYYDKINDKKGIAEVCINLGITFYNYKQLQDAELYLKRAEKVSFEIKNEDDLGLIWFNLGSVYSYSNNDSIAKWYLYKAKDFYIKTGDELGVATVDFNVANIVMKDDAKLTPIQRKDAIKIYYKTKEIFAKNEAFNYYLPCIITLGVELTKVGELEEAHKYLLEAKKLAIDMNDYNLLVTTYDKLALNADARGDLKEQVQFLKLYISGNDSLFRQSKAQAIADVQIKYQTDKKEAENVLLLKEAEIKDIELRQSQIIRVVLIIGLLLTVVFIVVIFNRFKTTQRQKKIIERQKHLVEEKQKEITDSIKYAKRLQEAILPPDSLVEKLLPNSFFLYKPKDIVSGDFYWVEEIEGGVLCAAADCTGHGVPGAFMSIVGNNLLREAANLYKITNPALILNSLNENISKILHQSEELSTVKDGMDISLLKLNRNSNVIEYAGAYNSMWLIRNKEVIEIPANKHPIGTFVGEELKKFDLKTVEVQKNDKLYLFTDGYADQFGGTKGKKFKYKPMQQLLISISDLPMAEQKRKLDIAFEEWKGSLEQVDDVLVIGIEI